MDAQQMTIRLPENLHEALRRASFTTRQPMNVIINRAVIAELDRMGRFRHETGKGSGEGGR